MIEFFQDSASCNIHFVVGCAKQLTRKKLNIFFLIETIFENILFCFKLKQSLHPANSVKSQVTCTEPHPCYPGKLKITEFAKIISIANPMQSQNYFKILLIWGNNFHKFLLELEFVTYLIFAKLNIHFQNLTDSFPGHDQYGVWRGIRTFRTN